MRRSAKAAARSVPLPTSDLRRDCICQTLIFHGVEIHQRVHWHSPRGEASDFALLGTTISLVRHDLESRIQHHDRVVRNIFVNNRVGADFHVAPDGYFSEHLRARRDVDVVSQGRHPRLLPLTGQADRDVLRNIAVPSDNDTRCDRDSAKMTDVEPRADRRGTWKLYSPYDFDQAIQDEIDRLKHQLQQRGLRVEPLSESDND